MAKKIKKTKKRIVKRKKLNIYQKINAIMAEVGKIHKTGYNSFNKYEYATEEDVLRDLRGVLIKYKLIILSSVIEEKMVDNITTLKIGYRIVDTEAPVGVNNPILVYGVGYGADKQDKGGYKAMTGALKYFLLKTFLLPSGTDPEEQTKKEGKSKSINIQESIEMIRKIRDKKTLFDLQEKISKSKLYKEVQKKVLLSAINESMKLCG